MKKIRWLAAIFVIAMIAIFIMHRQHEGEFQDGLMQLGLGFTAKSFCSCLYVIENSEDECRKFASLSQVSPKLSVDHERKKTISTLFFIFKREAQFVSPEEGCLLL